MLQGGAGILLRFIGLVAAFLLTMTQSGVAGDLSGAAEPLTPRHIGLVEDQSFHPMSGGDTVSMGLRLTRIARQEARSVESGEIDLTEYEGAALLVQGVIDGDWIYEAEILDRGSPILTELIKQLSDR